MWVDYWELTNRINEVQPPEFAAFVQRWPGTYVEDRLRNDWLLELVKRRDRATFAAEYPRFRMNDDREVTCFALADDQLSGKDVREAAVAAWLAQKDADDGCAFLAATLAEAKQLAPADIWKKVRLSIEANRPRAARQAAGLISDAVGAAMAEIVDSPARYLAKKAGTATRADAELTTVALARLAVERQRIGREPARRPLGARPARRPGVVRLGERRPPDRDQAAARGVGPVPARRPPARQDRSRDRALRRHARLEGARRAARRQRPRPLAAGGAGDQRDDAGRAEGCRLGLLEGARPAGAGARLAGRRVAPRHRSRAAGRHRDAAELLRRARRRGPRPAAGAAAQAGAADAAPSALPLPPTRVWRAR